MTYLALSLPGVTGDIHPPQYVPGGNGVGGGIMTATDILHNGLTIFYMVCVAIAVVLVVWSGIEWAMSGGDKTKIEAAKKRIMHVVTGLIIVFGAFFVISLFNIIFKVNLFALPF